MKKTSATLALGTLLVLASCTKERSIDTTDPDSPGGRGNSARLARVVLGDGQDSSVNLFTYGSGGRLATFTGTSLVGFEDVNVELRVERNSAGIITRIITKSEELEDAGIDSLVSRLNYNVSTGRYTSRVTTVEIAGFAFGDSTAYTYDGSGKIITAVSYFNEGLGFEESSKSEFGYVANNLASKQASEINANGDYEEIYTLTFGYDDKKAALELGNEAIILEINEYYSANNISSLAITDPSNPSGSDAVAIVYVYNSNNQPANGVLTSQASGETITSTYTYR